MEEDRLRWDERYSGHALAEPTAPDVVTASDDVRSLVPSSGRALDVACGAGGQSLWMAANGLDVLALDVSPTAIDLTRRAAAASDLERSVTERVHDFDSGLPDDAVGLAMLVCQRFRATALYGSFVDRLAPGGLAVVTVLSQVGLDIDAGPFHAPPGELVDAFRGSAVDVIHHCEAAGAASIAFLRR